MGMVRGLRGATTAADNTREAVLEATRELLEQLVEANDLRSEDVAGTFFTTSPDLNAEFPAVAARQMGWEYVPLICGHEMSVPTGLPLCIRVMVLVNTDKTQQEMKHLYLRDAENLRSRMYAPGDTE